MTQNYLFLTVGKTTESKEAAEIKRYIGVGSTYIKGVNPDKKTLDSFMGFESKNEPEYVKDKDDSKMAIIRFLTETDPTQCNDIDLKSSITFILTNVPAYNKDQTKVQVIDEYGNSTWASVEDAKAGKKLFSSNGHELKIGSKYRMAYRGEADLVAFLKTYLCIDDAFNYVNGSWVLKDNAADYLFGLEHIKDYFKGDFSELNEALKLQPNNKVKLLYGVRTTDKGQYQDIAARDELFLRNSAGAKAIAKMAEQLAKDKQAGAYASTEFKVQELAEYDVKATDLSTPQNNDPLSAGSEDEDNPWA